VGFAYLYTVLDMPRQIRIVCLHKVTVLCFVNNGKTQHRARAIYPVSFLKYPTSSHCALDIWLEVTENGTIGYIT